MTKTNDIFGDDSSYCDDSSNDGNSVNNDDEYEYGETDFIRKLVKQAIRRKEKEIESKSNEDQDDDEGRGDNMYVNDEDDNEEIDEEEIFLMIVKNIKNLYGQYALMHDDKLWQMIIKKADKIYNKNKKINPKAESNIECAINKFKPYIIDIIKEELYVTDDEESDDDDENKEEEGTPAKRSRQDYDDDDDDDNINQSGGNQSNFDLRRQPGRYGQW